MTGMQMLRHMHTKPHCTNLHTYACTHTHTHTHTCTHTIMACVCVREMGLKKWFVKNKVFEGDVKEMRQHDG